LAQSIAPDKTADGTVKVTTRIMPQRL